MALLYWMLLWDLALFRILSFINLLKFGKIDIETIAYLEKRIKGV